MSRAFSKLMGASEGRFLTALEQEQALAASLELPHRMLVSRLLHQFEFEIVDYATQAYCDIALDFEAPPGSMRRKKGHQMDASFCVTSRKPSAKVRAKSCLRKSCRVSRALGFLQR